jgi:hypothetical protein
MRASHALSRVAASFDEPNPVSCAGLMPVLALATGVGSGSLAAQHLTVPGGAGYASGAKVTGVVAGAVGRGGQWPTFVGGRVIGVVGRTAAVASTG